jgi:hypothetical protein
MMRAAPSYRHGDVFADMMRAVQRASERYDREALQLITPDLGPFGGVACRDSEGPAASACPVGM